MIQSVGDIFEFLDTDKSGSLSRDEIKELFFEHLNNPMGEVL